MNPVTSLSFDVRTDDYGVFIQSVRHALTHSVSYHIPVLAPEWLVIRLIAADDIITVRVQRSNLYIRGYKRTSRADDFFWEFTDTHLITGSHDLMFSGSYAGGLDPAGVIRRGLPLGGTLLEDAIHNLAQLESPAGSQEAARSLLVIIQMIVEAARYKTIAEHIITNYLNGGMIDSRMLAMESSWSLLSKAVINSENGVLPDYIVADNPTEVHTLDEAQSALGVLLYHARRGNERSLMNLEYVRVDDFDTIPGRDHCNLFGSVTVDHGWDKYTFYYQSSCPCQDVRRGEFAKLTDPDHSFPVSGEDAFIISFRLFDHVSLDHDLQIARGEIVWDRMTSGNYDRHLQKVVTGVHGGVTVGYSVLSSALGVTIQVLLINDDDVPPLDEVSGKLTASQVLGGSEGLVPITLFDRKSWGPRGQEIPLTRKVIAASTSTELKVTAELWGKNRQGSSPFVIADGNAEFTVEPGMQSQIIGGVQVIITCR